MTLQESLSYQPVELAFGTSGLRGLITDMTDLECYINAAGYVQFLLQADGVKARDTVYLAGDLRQSTPRITQVMVAAIENAGLRVVYGGSVPTPAIAYFALLHNAPCIMVTGSHIPADRNGIKFYKRAGELLKKDEPAMKDYVAQVRATIYQTDMADSIFTSAGEHSHLPEIPTVAPEIAKAYKKRYTDVFAADSLAGKHVVMYQHSAVGRDIVPEILESLGASVSRVGRSDVFVPIDTENVTAKERALFKQFAEHFDDTFAVVSTDGDSDRPFVIDETGKFHRGDVLGLLTAGVLGARFAAVPISANDTVDEYCNAHGVELTHTRIGSPFVIVAMEQAATQPTVGWEVNGGFLTGHDIVLGEGVLKALPTRDAVLPILCALISASRKGNKVSEVFAALPARYTGGGLVDHIPEEQMVIIRNLHKRPEYAQQLADTVFGGSTLGKATLNTLDGIRLVFESGDVIHLRASGNAPQVRVYTNAGSQTRADELVAEALSDKGYIQRLLTELS